MENREIDFIAKQHKDFFFDAKFQCGICNKKFPKFYYNKGNSYWGDRGRYNFRGAVANFNRHTKSCGKKNNYGLFWDQCPKCEHIGDFLLKLIPGTYKAECSVCNKKFEIELTKERMIGARSC